MSRTTVLASALLALLGVGMVTWALNAQVPKDTARPEALSDKPMLILSKQNNVEAHLEQPRIRTIGGRQFVIGKEVKDSRFVKDKFGGATVWVPLDDVAQLVEDPK
jgi:hypothetical protein